MGMRWFQFTILDFEQSLNPPNCGIVVIERKADQEGNQWFELTDSSYKLLGFQKAHAKGSLWRVLEDVRYVEDGEENVTLESLQNKYKDNFFSTPYLDRNIVNEMDEKVQKGVGGDSDIVTTNMCDEGGNIHFAQIFCWKRNLQIRTDHSTTK